MVTKLSALESDGSGSNSGSAVGCRASPKCLWPYELSSPTLVVVVVKTESDQACQMSDYKGDAQ